MFIENFSYIKYKNEWNSVLYRFEQWNQCIASQRIAEKKTKMSEFTVKMHPHFRFSVRRETIKRYREKSIES